MGTGQWKPFRKSEIIPVFEDNQIESRLRNTDWFNRGEAGGVDRFYFRVFSPGSGDIFADVGNFDNRANRSFMARLYANPGPPTGRVAIVFNGLDETIFQVPDEERLFSFYESLGVHLAQNGCLTILLPTPYHMNRALAYVSRPVEQDKQARFGEKYRDFTVPTNALMQNTFNIFRNHFQGFKETLGLCQHLVPDRMRRAYPRLRSRGVLSTTTAQCLADLLGPGGASDVFLVGYSLGGLRALSEYVRDRHVAKKDNRQPIFSGCVAVNSGGSLDTLPNPPWVDRDHWKDMIHELLLQRLSSRPQRRLVGIPAEEREEAEQHFSFLEDVFLGQGIAVNELERQDAEKMLFILGGGDELVPLESLHRFRPPGGLTILHIASLGHLLAYDEAWAERRKLVLEVIGRFIEGASGPRLTAATKRTIKYLALVDHELPILPYSAELDKDPSAFQDAISTLAKRRDNHDLGDRVLGRVSMEELAAKASISVAAANDCFVDYVQFLLTRLNINVQRKLWHPRSYARTRRALMLGTYLFPGRDMDEIRRDWRDSLLPRLGSRKLGDHLVGSGIIAQEVLDRSLARQHKELDEIRDQMREDFGAYLTQHAPDLPDAACGATLAG